MRERQHHKLPFPMHIKPGDLLVCEVDDKGAMKTHQFQEKIGRHLTVDTIVTFDVDEPTFGLVDGIGIIFGDSGKRK